MRFIKRSLLQKLLLLICSISFYGASMSQSVTGKVTDQKDVPIDGASVLIKNTSAGVSTNSKGEFTLNVSKGAVLVISSTGYTTKQVVVTGPVLTIKLELGADNLMGDVVVIGYGTQKKVNLTGSVVAVDKKMLENRPVTNAIDALQGAAPGLTITRTNGQPGKEGWNMNVRGFSSLNGTNSPLVLVDGVEGQLSNVNPNDIESISVLKDAAAAAIYGAKAAGGVVLVTTKKGSSGKIKIGYSGLYTIKKPYSMPTRIHSWEEGQMANLANENAGLADAYTQQQIGWMKNPDSSFVPNDPYKLYYYYDLNQMPILLKKTTPSNSHEVFAQGGTDKTQYFFSLGYYGAQGIFKFGPDNNQRYNVRINVNTKLSNVFSLDSRVAYTQNLISAPTGAANGDGGLFYQIYQLRTRFPIFLPGDSSKYASTGSGATLYPLLKAGGYSNSIEHNFNGVFTLKADNLVKGLGLRLIYSPQLDQTNGTNFYQTIPLWTYSNGVPTIATYLNNPDKLQKTRVTQTSSNVQALADYDLNISNDHHFHLLGGFQYQSYNYDYLSAQNTSLILNNLASLNYTSNSTINPNFVGDNVQSNVWVSYFGKLDYNYREKYFLEGTLRNDASSRLAPAHRNQVFPSISAAWRVNRENWFNSVLPGVNELKIRGSYGTLGNAQLGTNYQNNYNYYALLNSGPAYPFNNSSTPSLYQSTLPSPSLGWETIATSDAGFDLTLLRYRLSIGFDYFVRDNNNMLITVNQPALLGVTPSTVNGASMRSKGWEAIVSWKDKVGNVSYWVNANISDNTNKIKRYDGNLVYSEGINTAIPGLPINTIFGYKALGYFQTKDEVTKSPIQFGFNNQGPGDIKYLDANGDGVINAGKGTKDNHGDLVNLGNTSPRYLFGLNLGAQWKGFDFSVFFQGVGKRNLIVNPQAVLPFEGTYKMPWEINKNYWTPDNPSALFPRLYTGGGTNDYISSQWVQNAAYVRLKNIQVGYNLPAKVVAKAGIQSARIFFSGQDIWEKNKMWFKYYDAENPDVTTFGYPFFRSYAFGLNIVF
jgi:TonB-linked SusC/RagA family outer membrane protein